MWRSVCGVQDPHAENVETQTTRDESILGVVEQLMIRMLARGGRGRLREKGLAIALQPPGRLSMFTCSLNTHALNGSASGSYGRSPPPQTAMVEPQSNKPKATRIQRLHLRLLASTNGGLAMAELVCHTIDRGRQLRT